MISLPVRIAKFCYYIISAPFKLAREFGSILYWSVVVDRMPMWMFNKLHGKKTK